MLYLIEKACPAEVRGRDPQMLYFFRAPVFAGQARWVSVPGSGFKPAVARLDVDMKLFSLSMNLAYYKYILIGQVWARGSKVIKS